MNEFIWDSSCGPPSQCGRHAEVVAEIAEIARPQGRSPPDASTLAKKLGTVAAGDGLLDAVLRCPVQACKISAFVDIGRYHFRIGRVARGQGLKIPALENPLKGFKKKRS